MHLPVNRNVPDLLHRYYGFRRIVVTVKEMQDMWWHDVLWGLFNGFTGWIVVIAHIFGFLEDQPLYDVVRQGNWYDVGFLLGAGSPFLGFFRRK